VQGQIEAEGTLETLLDTCAAMWRIWQGDSTQSCAEHRKEVISDRYPVDKRSKQSCERSV
jgi:hypothetical protein